jgi:hypothetical protein
MSSKFFGTNFAQLNAAISRLSVNPVIRAAILVQAGAIVTQAVIAGAELGGYWHLYLEEETEEGSGITGQQVVDLSTLETVGQSAVPEEFGGAEGAWDGFDAEQVREAIFAARGHLPMDTVGEVAIAVLTVRYWQLEYYASKLVETGLAQEWAKVRRWRYSGGRF